MRKWFLGCIFVGVALASPNFAHAGGHGVPTPFSVGSSNRHVELADGEVYTLYGTVVIGNDTFGAEEQAYLQVDLAAQPWLANNLRRVSPYYPLSGDLSYWRQYQGQRIRISVKAHGQVVNVAGRGYAYLLSLEPVFGTLTNK